MPRMRSSVVSGASSASAALKRLARRVAEHVDVEAIRERRARDRARLDLGQRQPARGEPHQDLAERARAIREREHERGLRRAASGATGAGRGAISTKRVALPAAVWIARRDDREPVRRSPPRLEAIARERAIAELATRRAAPAVSNSCASGEVRMLGEERLALRECLRMRDHVRELGERRRRAARASSARSRSRPRR